MAVDARMRKVIVTIPPALLESVDALTARLNMGRSQLVRAALDAYIAEAERRELRVLLREAYQVNADRDLAICREFEHADHETLVKYAPPYEEAKP